MIDPSLEAELPKLDLKQIEEFESKRCGYFSDEYRKSALYWSCVCGVMTDNNDSTQQVLNYMTGRLEADRMYTSAVYSNADKIFGDKKGTTKLRHDKIRHAELKAKLDGKAAPTMEDALIAGGAGREPMTRPTSGPVKAVWEMVETDCRAARERDILCDVLEQEDNLGAVKVMSKEMQRRMKELTDEGDACLLSLANIDKRVAQSFVHLKEAMGDQLGGKALHEDIWFLDCAYHTAVVHQKEAWVAVTTRLGEVFNKMKDLECERRKVLRQFMIDANAVTGESWSKLRALCDRAMASANSVDASRGTVDAEVSIIAETGMDDMKKRGRTKKYELPNVSHIVPANPAPSNTSFVDALSAPLESPLVRAMMMIERREGKAIGSKYHAGLMVLSWGGFAHFFDVPDSSTVKKDASPAAALQEISPHVSLDELIANKKDLEEALTFKSTYTLQFDESSTAAAVSSHKSHKIDVKGKVQLTSIKRHFKAGGTSSKTVTFRCATEAEMNHALAEIKDCISARGGMPEAVNDRQSTGSMSSSFGSSFHSNSGSGRISIGESGKAPSAAALDNTATAPSSTVDAVAAETAPPAPATAPEPAPAGEEPAEVAPPAPAPAPAAKEPVAAAEKPAEAAATATATDGKKDPVTPPIDSAADAGTPAAGAPTSEPSKAPPAATAVPAATPAGGESPE